MCYFICLLFYIVFVPKTIENKMPKVASLINICYQTIFLMKNIINQTFEFNSYLNTFYINLLPRTIL